MKRIFDDYDSMTASAQWDEAIKKCPDVILFDNLFWIHEYFCNLIDKETATDAEIKQGLKTSIYEVLHQFD